MPKSLLYSIGHNKEEKVIKNKTKELMGHLYVECKMELYETALEAVKDTYLAEDIVDDVFLHIIYHHRWWKDQKYEVRKKYADTICAMLCKRYQKDQSKIKAYSYSDEVLFTKALTTSCYTKYVESEVIRQLLKALKVADRDIFKKRYFNELPVHKIAEETNMSENNVSQRLARGRKLLRRELDMY